jgi:hypothetical protein
VRWPECFPTPAFFPSPAAPPSPPLGRCGGRRKKCGTARCHYQISSLPPPQARPAFRRALDWRLRKDRGLVLARDDLLSVPGCLRRDTPNRVRPSDEPSKPGPERTLLTHGAVTSTRGQFRSSGPAHDATLPSSHLVCITAPVSNLPVTRRSPPVALLSSASRTAWRLGVSRRIPGSATRRPAVSAPAPRYPPSALADRLGRTALHTID